MSWTAIQRVPVQQSGTNASTVISGISAVGAGHLLVIGSWIGSLTKPITSITGGETWVNPGKFADPSGGGNSLDLRYVLSSTGGETSFTVNYASDTNFQGAIFMEFSYTAGSIALDDAQVRQPVGSETNPAGATLTVTGASDVVIQAAAINTDPTAISGSFTRTSIRFGCAIGDLVNTASGTAPTWTAAAENPGNFYALAFKELASGGVEFTSQRQQPTIQHIRSIQMY